MIVILLLYLFVCILMLFSYASISLSVASVITLTINISTFIYYTRKYQRDNLLSFHFLFSLSYFLSVYAYFIIGRGHIDYSGYKILLNINNELFVIKALVVSTMAYLIYIFGAYLANNRKKDWETVNYTYSKEAEWICFLLSFVLFLLFFIFKTRIIVRAEFTEAILLYTVVVFLNNKVLGTNSLRLFFRRNKLYCFLFILSCYFFLVMGSRHGFLTIFLPAVVLFSLYIKTIRKRYIFIGIILFWLLFIWVKYARVDMLDEFNMKNMSLFGDFLPASLATPFFIEYTESYGYTYGSNYLLVVLSIIPFLAGLVQKSGFVSAQESHYFFTTYINGEDFDSGLGTSMVGDLYYSFGFIGVVVAFFLVGYFSSWLHHENTTNPLASPYAGIAFCGLMSEAFFMTRGVFLIVVKPIAFMFIVYFIITIITRQRR